MTETNDWNTAPADGSEINVLFPDGTKASARWNAQAGRWEVLRNSDEWVSMQYEHGRSKPISWYP